MNRETININNDEAQCEAIETCHHKYVMDNDTCETLLYFLLSWQDTYMTPK